MGKRHSIYVAEFQHRNPIPAACRIGPMLITGVIAGRDPATAEVPPTLEAQADLVFSHIKTIVEAGGGTTDDILKINIQMKNPSDRAALNDVWLRMFPDENNRPARHTSGMVGDSGPSLVTADFMAVIED